MDHENKTGESGSKPISRFVSRSGFPRLRPVDDHFSLVLNLSTELREHFDVLPAPSASAALDTPFSLKPLQQLPRRAGAGRSVLLLAALGRRPEPRPSLRPDDLAHPPLRLRPVSPCS